MDITLIIGLTIIITVYGMIWFLIFKSKNIIQNINKSGLKSSREIEQKLEL